MMVQTHTHIRCQRFLSAAVFTLALISALPLFAQVEHKKEWSPAREIKVAVPPAAHLEERARAFEQRDSEDVVRRLADQLFALIDAAYRPEDEQQAALYCQVFVKRQAGDARGALESYKAFVFERLRHPPKGVKIDARDPAKRTFIEYYNQPDELMRGVYRLQVFDEPWPQKVANDGVDSIIAYYRAGKHNAHMIDLVMQNGQPGRMNWTYMPPGFCSGTWHIPQDRNYIGGAYQQDMCLTPLLAAFLEKKDPAYLKQWAAYVDDFLLNFRRDLADAGILMGVDAGGAAGPNFRHLAYVILNSAEADQHLPATTLVRFFINTWTTDLPLIVLGARATAANRAMHMYGALLTENTMNFPELKYAPTLLTERRRIIESYARQYMQPDGTSVDYAPNYNKNYLLSPGTDIALFRAMKQPPAWFTPVWEQELLEHQMVMARYLIRYFAPNGTLPGYKGCTKDMRAETIGKSSYLKKFMMPALAEPANKVVIARILGDTTGPAPAFTSEGYPYGGYYFMRDAWAPDARFLYFHDFRPAQTGNWRHQKNVALQAYGQSMLNPFKWESPLLVDGAGNMYEAYTDLYPSNYLARAQRPLYGTRGDKSAWQYPLSNRWHTSASFDLAEGSLRLPYAGKFEDRPSVFVEDVSHARQVIFFREAGCWVVTDRVQAEKPHTYRLQWSFEPDRLNAPDWYARDQVKKFVMPPPREDAYTRDQIKLDSATQSIKTANPKHPNLSIWQAASVPLLFNPASTTQGNDAWHGNAHVAGSDFKAEREALVASLLYPRRMLAEEVNSFERLTLKNGAGFKTVTPAGFGLTYQALLHPAALEAEGIHVNASALAVSRKPDGTLNGLVLDCTQFALVGKSQKLSSADMEFAVEREWNVTFTPIYRPLERVVILPETDLFLDAVEVTLQHPTKDVDLRFTLDGTEPTLASARYEKPIRLAATTRVRARAFRKGASIIPPTQDSVLASVDRSAIFTKATELKPALAAPQEPLKPGLAFRYFEDDWTLSILKLPILKPLSTGVARSCMDISARRQNANSYAFVYEGVLDFPATGIYTFHGTWEFFDIGVRCGYDLQVVLDGEPWYPSTRDHNFGNWSIALKQGLHALKVTYVDIRRGQDQVTAREITWSGDKPDLRVSGPGLTAQPIPDEWMKH